MKFLPARAARFGARARRRGSIVLGVLALASASCSTNESGRLGADRTGDVSATPIARVAVGDGAAVCAGRPGEGAGGGALSRAPYLQRMTAHDAVVVWTSVGGGAASVLVESPDGEQQTSVPGAIDPSVPRETPDYWSGGAPAAGAARQWMATVSGLAPDTTYCYTVYQDGEP